MWKIDLDDLDSDDTRALIAEHGEQMRSQSPAESCHVLGAEALTGNGFRLYTARNGNELGGMVALKRLDECHAELKSMRTTIAARGTGLGRALLR